MTITAEQRGVITGMVAAVLVAAFTLIGSCFIWPSTPLSTGLSHRMAMFAMAALFPCLTLAASIGRLAHRRFFTDQDIGGSASQTQTEEARLLQALIQNTLEQTVLGLAAYAAWSALAPVRFLAVVPAASALFFLGRILFFIRYKDGAAARSFGFAMTFYPTVALTLGNLYFAATCMSTLLHSVQLAS